MLTINIGQVSCNLILKLLHILYAQHCIGYSVENQINLKHFFWAKRLHGRIFGCISWTIWAGNEVIWLTGRLTDGLITTSSMALSTNESAERDVSTNQSTDQGTQDAHEYLWRMSDCAFGEVNTWGKFFNLKWIWNSFEK